MTAQTERRGRGRCGRARGQRRDASSARERIPVRGAVELDRLVDDPVTRGAPGVHQEIPVSQRRAGRRETQQPAERGVRAHGDEVAAAGDPCGEGSDLSRRE